MPITIADIALAALFAIIVIRAALRGFVEELTGAVWLAGGLLFAVSFYRESARFIRANILSDIPLIPEILAFLALFFLAFLLIKIVGGMLKDIVERSGLSVVDHALGFVFGVLKGALVIAALLFFLSAQPFFDGKRLIRGSVIASWLMPNRAVVERILERVDV